MNLPDTKKLILSGQIKVFNDLFLHVTVAEVARVLGCSTKHINYVRQNPGKLYVGEFFKLADAIGVKREKVAKLFEDS